MKTVEDNLLELDKRKYKKSEVEKLLQSQIQEQEKKALEEKEGFLEILNENKRLKAQLNEYKNKEALINNAILRAEEKAKEIEKSAWLKYALEIENIKMFHIRFKTYFDYLMEKYPYYPATKEAQEIYEKLLASATQGLNDKEKIQEAEKGLVFQTAKSNKKGEFNPKKMMDEYIATTGDNGFNLDEVLNPGELHLEDLCKELGLIEE